MTKTFVEKLNDATQMVQNVLFRSYGDDFVIGTQLTAPILDKFFYNVREDLRQKNLKEPGYFDEAFLEKLDKLMSSIHRAFKDKIVSWDLLNDLQRIIAEFTAQEKKREQEEAEGIRRSAAMSAGATLSAEAPRLFDPESVEFEESNDIASAEKSGAKSETETLEGIASSFMNDFLVLKDKVLTGDLTSLGTLIRTLLDGLLNVIPKITPLLQKGFSQMIEPFGKLFMTEMANLAKPTVAAPQGTVEPLPEIGSTIDANANAVSADANPSLEANLEANPKSQAEQLKILIDANANSVSAADANPSLEADLEANPKSQAEQLKILIDANAVSADANPSLEADLETNPKSQAEQLILIDANAVSADANPSLEANLEANPKSQAEQLKILIDANANAVSADANPSLEADLEANPKSQAEQLKILEEAFAEFFSRTTAFPAAPNETPLVFSSGVSESLSKASAPTSAAVPVVSATATKVAPSRATPQTSVTSATAAVEDVPSIRATRPTLRRAAVPSDGYLD